MFAGNATGGSARIITNGNGIFDISRETSIFGFPTVFVGSVEGDGGIQLGGVTLTFGSLGTGTTFSGSIVDGGIGGGTGGSIVKMGAGTTTLSRGASLS